MSTLKNGNTSFYKLDTSSKDVVGGFNGTDTNVTYDDTSASFNGTSSSILFGTASTNSYIQNTGIFTISIFVNRASATTGYFLGNTIYLGPDKGYLFGTIADGRVFVGVFNGPSWLYLIANGNIPVSTNTETHLLFSADGSNLNCYVNNVFSFSVARNSSNSTGDATRAATIGQAAGYNTDRFNGRIRNLGFWNRVVTAQERTLLYNGYTPVQSNFFPFFQ